jgi:large subunit ribosomal protein L21
MSGALKSAQIERRLEDSGGRTFIVYAVIETGGKQYRVSEGDTIRVERMQSEPGSTVELTSVLLLGKDDEPVVGSPLVSGASVKASVVSHGKEDKVIVFKYRRKKNYRRFKGHRQQYTDLKVESINE